MQIISFSFYKPKASLCQGFYKGEGGGGVLSGLEQNNSHRGEEGGGHVQNTSHSIDGWCISHVSFLAFASANPLEFSALKALSELIKDVLLVTGPDSSFGTS